MAYVKPNTISGEITASPHNTNYDYIINALNSYDGSNIAALSIPSTAIAADAITGAKIADESIDSEHYVDGSIDTAHLSDDVVTNDKLYHTDGHIVISPDENKLVKIAVLRQNDTMNAYQNNSVILTGWGYIASSAVYSVTETVTFGITFDVEPIILAQYVGYSASGTTYTNTDIGLTAAGQYRMNAIATDPRTTAFLIALSTGDGSNLASSGNQFYTWIAIGVLS